MDAADLQRNWYDASIVPSLGARTLASIYGCVTAVRRSLYRRAVLRSVRLSVPVVVVGNIVAGGAGKTPLTIALVEALRARGCKPGVVSRGYGGSAMAPLLLDAQPDPLAAGDEPALIRTRTGAPVAVGIDRAAAGRLLVGAGVDVVVADDGLQRYALARDVEICVVDGERRFGNGWLLPAGPLREPLARLRSVDFVVCNGGTAHAGEIPMRLASSAAVTVDGSGREQALRAFAGQRVHALAGIGNPARFFAALREAGMDVVAHPFPDHHPYAAVDLDFHDDLPVLMTEKDAVKCRAFARPDWWAVPVQAELPSAFLDAVAARLARR